ncbi:uncharacterized protein VTP21DRAFT_627 [Calcarisporiella thermophila]|uniref:uncharacterized protein n=1 Tax=Calcarisporiella thermophila TaxID=911321 RepID=UPI003742A995
MAVNSMLSSACVFLVPKRTIPIPSQSSIRIARLPQTQLRSPANYGWLRCSSISARYYTSPGRAPIHRDRRWLSTRNSNELGPHEKGHNSIEALGRRRSPSNGAPASSGANNSGEGEGTGGDDHGHGRDPKDGSEGGSGSNGEGGAQSGSGGSGGGESGSGGGGSPFDGMPRTLNVLENSLQKPSIPDNYPQVLALPITRRPLFPGFYKAVVVKNPQVTAAIKELVKRGQPYVGAFLLKDEEQDVDIVSAEDQVYKVGVFAQITNVFPAGNADDQSLTAVLYPHRRIRMSELITPGASEDGAPKPAQAKIEELPEEPAVAGGEETAIEKSQEQSPQQQQQQQAQYATTFLRNYAVSLANVENLADEPHSKRNRLVRAVTSEIVAVFKDIAALNPLFRDQIANFSMSHAASNIFEEPAKLADFAAAVSAGEPRELQEVLESLVIEERLQKALLVLKKELLNAQLQNKISKDVESKIAKRQREYYLMEQLKGIKRELGIETDGKEKLVESFKEKAEKLAMPEQVKKVFEEEVNKLAHLEPVASEFNVTRNYLDWLTQIPWGRRSMENYNIQHAVSVLNEDHHGLQDVKDRILEFIAVGKLRGTVEGKILCLVGPPGVGKTSIGKSIARALNREFYRFSVGGLTDVAEIKGHRRTYVGAMPGKVIQALKKVQTENPLVLIDEVDKIGRGHQGDPSSALLELLDPEQNSSFLDHYMDVPVDLSKVLFVCTANVLDTIPGPLLDRMEVIQLSGYVAEEKLAIASQYLAPQAKAAAGLEHAHVELHSDAMEALIKNYCRESGVRNLKKHIDKVYRKAALKIVRDIAGEERLPSQELDSPEVKDRSRVHDPVSAQHDREKVSIGDSAGESAKSEEKKITMSERSPLAVPPDVQVDITAQNLQEYVGAPIFHSDRLYDRTPPGVVMGLAWTSMGGSSLYVESVLEAALRSQNSHPMISKTGQMGDVMKESTSIAYTFAKAFVARRWPSNRFFEHASIHLHVPEGATPKDGPSAGITMATSLLSLALDRPVNPDVAMTGELTLTGKVLRIGGLREKVVAAKRSGVKKVIFPKANISDWEELPDYVKEGVEGVPVEWYNEVFGECFGEVDGDAVGKEVWGPYFDRVLDKKADVDQDEGIVA